jgi:L-lactate dehydrogenase complex protein LldF
VQLRIRPNTSAVLSDANLQANLRPALEKSLQARDRAVAEVSNWEELRQHAHDVKDHTLSRLDHYLEELERKVIAQGGKVVWADTGAEALEFIVGLLQEREIKKVAKSKTMLGEEIHLNEELERAQLDPVETDLGEYIIQLSRETPFHIVTPALHKSKEEVVELFGRELGMPPTDDVEAITATARAVLRRHFLTAGAGITGVNFGVAETGTLVVVENEGNVRLCASLPEVHIAIMGIEKVIPRARDLAVFLKLLSRSATGQKSTSYVNFINGPRREGEWDGPRDFYLVLVDNGRSRILADPELRQTLACIRCGACLNVCPVYQRIGGHAYGSTYQGPIGAILTPQLTSAEAAPEHPFASSLCGACYEICPVKIEIPHILLKLRERVQRSRQRLARQLPLEAWAMQFWAWAMSSPSRYGYLGNLLRRVQPYFVREGRLRIPIPPFSGWDRYRDLPPLPEKSFREQLRALSKEEK